MLLNNYARVFNYKLVKRSIFCRSSSSQTAYQTQYRGYDSVGIGTINDGKVSVRKGVGRVEEVDSTLLLRILP